VGLGGVTLIAWLYLLMTAAFLLFGVLYRRHLFIKPSMIVALFFHVQVQWPSTLYWEKIAGNMAAPEVYFFLAHLFPLLLVIGSLQMGGETAKEIFAAITNSAGDMKREELWVYAPLTLVSLGILVWYLSVVPWDQTGLYAMLFRPENSKLAREQSLKLLSNKTLKYAYSIFNSAIAPVLACLIGIKALNHWQARRVGRAFLTTLLLLPILITVSITGARGPGVMILLAVIFAVLLVKGLPFRPGKIALILLLILTLPAVLDFLRRGESLDPSGVTNSYKAIVERTIGYGMTEDAQWHLQYVTNHGLWGVAGIEKLAPWFGVRPVDILNVVGRYYRPEGGTISANAATVFLYYACFGWIALPLCLVLTWLLDLALIIYRRMTTVMLTVVAAACGIAAVNVVHTFYTTVLVTHGFLVILIICFLLDRVVMSLTVLTKKRTVLVA